MRNLIFRGISEDGEVNKNEKVNLEKIFRQIGCKDLTERSFVYAGKLNSKFQGPRPLKVEFNLIQEKKDVAIWREKLEKKGINF